MKTVLITGAGSGIGLAAVKLFLQKGYFVLAHYHNSCEALKSFDSSNIRLFQADFGNSLDVEKLAIECLKVSDVDILVNNAGDYMAKNSLEDVFPGDLEKTYKINAVAPFLLTKILIERMKSNKWGRIVNISSIGVKYGGSLNSIGYTMSKAAIESMTLSFARYAAEDNVLVNCIRVGVTDTDFHLKSKNKDMQKRAEMVPMKRLASPDEIAKSIYFLASEQSSFCCGSLLTVAGGE